MSDKRTAPHDLDLVIDFVNTADLETGEEALSDRDGLARWLSEHGLLPARRGVSGGRSADRRSSCARRCARTMLANNGGPRTRPLPSGSSDAARRGELERALPRGRPPRSSPAPRGPTARSRRCSSPVAEAMADGSWARVKACRADDCHWAFYDFSRNRAGTWCDMAVCGNREKVRAYRERAPVASPSPSASWARLHVPCARTDAWHPLGIFDPVCGIVGYVGSRPVRDLLLAG